MSHCILCLDLSPLSPPDGATLRFGLQMFGATHDLPDAQARVDALRMELDGIAGEMPVEPADQAGFKPWQQVESAFVQHLGEFLPWCWTSSTIRLQAASTRHPHHSARGAPGLHANSLSLARRGYLRAMYSGSAGCSDPLMFQQRVQQPSGATFSLWMFSAQATRWPAPVPQEPRGTPSCGKSRAQTCNSPPMLMPWRTSWRCSPSRCRDWPIRCRRRP